MFPAPPQVGRTHPPLRGTLEIVEKEDIPWGELEDHPMDGAMDVSSRNFRAHM